MAKPARPRAKAKRIRDVALIVDRTEDREGFQILRQRGDDPVELGTVRPLIEGKPIDGEVVSLKAHKDVPLLYDVKTEFPAPQAGSSERRRLTSQGPAQVASEEYRRGWEAIWGQPPGDGKPN
jgi:hypothetical protein